MTAEAAVDSVLLATEIWAALIALIVPAVCGTWALVRWLDARHEPMRVAAQELRVWVHDLPQDAALGPPPMVAAARARAADRPALTERLKQLTYLRSLSEDEQETRAWIEEYGRTRQEFERELAALESSWWRRGLAGGRDERR